MNNSNVVSMNNHDKQLNEDILLGKLVKQQRENINVSQKKMAEILDISYQQLQKYELGQNRIPAVKMFEIAKAMNTPVAYFDEELEKLRVVKKNEKSPNIHFRREQSLKIYLIEDSSADELLIREAIDESSVDVDISSNNNADEALNHLKQTAVVNEQNLPDIILLDLNLPKMSGFDTLGILKKDRVLCKIPVIVISNTIDTDDLERSYALQASGFVGKSMDNDVFTYNIASLLQYWANTVVLPSMQYK